MNSHDDQNLPAGEPGGVVSPDVNLMLEKALAKIRAQKKQIETLEGSRSQAIALVGIGCRFPGNVNTPQEFWELLVRGESVISETPEGRWSVDRYFDKTGTKKGTMYTNAGGFITDVEQFDPSFFGLTPREARAMDPQHRLLLEVVYESLEDAGLQVKELKGSKTSVVVGMGSDDYRQYLNNSHDETLIDPYTSLGTTRSIAVGRIAYLLGLQGPAFQLDTSCSSSLLAIHLSCQMLRNGESDLAIAGGVNLMLTPEMSIGFSELQALSYAGECRAFDEGADGYVRGEGCGVVVLKRLSDAQHDGDNIYAIIKGSAVNHDGRSNGLTAPNGAAQEQVIRDALVAATLSPQDVHYVEAHGTGTKLGDPIEVLSLGRVYGERSAEHAPLYLGSVKSAIGHLEAGAGVASFIKTALALKNNTLPPQPCFEQPNKHIPWSRLPLSVAREPMVWPGQSIPTAGISAFGMSGTNVHLILSAQAPGEASAGNIEQQTGFHLAMLSAESPQSLQLLADKYIQFLANIDAQFSPAQFARSCNQSRSLMRYRAAFVGREPADFIRQLSRLKDSTASIEPATTDAAKVAFLFTGQGSQYVGMGKSLYDNNLAFKQILNEVAALVDEQLGCSIKDIMWPSVTGKNDGEIASLNNDLSQTLYTQPALFALEYALAKLWMLWGIKPKYLIGHSVGEIVAACIAGVFGLVDAVKLVCARAQLMQALPAIGAMIAVHTNEKKILSYLDSAWPDVAIAGINSPEQCVLAGDEKTLQDLAERLRADDIALTPLNVSHAFHSPLMAPMLNEFSRVAASITYHPPKITIISTVDASLPPEAFADAGYWVTQICAGVRFSDGIEKVSQLGCSQFIEVGPKPSLIGMALATLGDLRYALPSLQKNQDDWEFIQRSIGKWLVNGMNFDFEQFYASQGAATAGERLRLPSYSFDRQHYFVEGPTVERYRHAQAQINLAANNIHPLLGEQLILPLSKEIRFQHYLTQDKPVYMQDHLLFGHVIGAAASHISSFICAAEKTLASPQMVCTHIRDILVTKPLLLSDVALPVQVILQPEEQGFSAHLVSLPERKPGSVDTHVIAHLYTDANSLRGPETTNTQVELALNGANTIGNDQFYKEHAQLGFRFGPRFQLINKLLRVDLHHSLVEVKSQNDILALDGNATDYPIYPAQLDVCVQVLGDLMNAQIDNSQHTYIPFSIAQVNFEHFLMEPSAPLMCEVRLHPDQDFGADSLLGDIWIWQAQGALLATVKDFEWRKVANEVMRESLRSNPHNNDCYQWAWRDQDVRGSLPAAASKTGNVVIFAEHNALSAAVIALYRSRNIPCRLVYPSDNYQNSGDKITVNPAQKSHFDQLSQDVSLIDAQCIYLWSGGGDLEKACIGLTHWLQCAQKISRLIIVSQHFADGLINDGPFYGDIGHAFLGYARSLILERPELRCATLHAAQHESVDVVAELTVQILNSTYAEEHFQLVNSQVKVARLKSTALPKQTMQFKTDGAYLLTGALGGIGRLLLSWLVAQGAENVVLLSHRDVNDEERAWLASFNRNITVEILDVAKTRVGQLTGFINKLDRPLAGVFHLAGRLHDALLEDLDVNKFHQVIEGKALGAWNLVNAIAAAAPQKTAELDFMVMFSSASGVLGSAGQINYASANAYLDGLVDFARAQGVPAQSIAWGLWAGVGMGADAALVAHLQKSGLVAIESEEAFSNLSRFLAQAKHNSNDGEDFHRLCVFPCDWSVYLNSHYADRGNAPALFSELVAVPPQLFAENTKLPEQEQNNIARLQAMPLVAREREIVQLVKGQLKKVMSIDIAHVDMDRPLQELGMDSLMAVAIRDGIGKYVGQKLPPALLFKQPSAAALIKYLLDEFFQQDENVQTPPGSEDQDHNIDIDALLEMSDDEVDLLLDTIEG